MLIHDFHFKDLTDASSFEKADYWVSQILANEPVSCFQITLKLLYVHHYVKCCM